MTTTDLHLEGAATLLSSLIHGGEHAGTIGYLRREKFIQPDGTVAEVPVVSGNAVRGVLRRHSARLLWEQLGRPELDLPTFHVLMSGGALAKAGAGHVLSSPQLQELYQLVPHVSVFGAAGGGRIIGGRLQVGKMVPVCAETAHVMPDGIDTSTVRPVHDLLQIEEYSRLDSAKQPAELVMLADADGDGDGDPDDGVPATQMRYGHETLAVGTLLHWWLRLRAPNDLEVACLAAALRSWAAAGAHLGGRSATGHGRVAVHTDRWQIAQPQLTDGSDLTSDIDLAGWTADRRDDILTALSWLR